jgi:predicted ATPase
MMLIDKDGCPDLFGSGLGVIQMIKEIQISRFKNLRHTDRLSLGKINLLAGANGCGKSSFCQVLLCLSQTWRKGAMNNLLPQGIWKSLGNYDDIHYAYDEDPTMEFLLKSDQGIYNEFKLAYRKSFSTPTLGEIENAFVNGKPIFDDSSSSDESTDGYDHAEEEESLLSSLSDYPNLLALRNLYYIAADRKAAPNKETLDETTPIDYISPNGSNVLNVLWKYREKGVLPIIEELIKKVLEGGMIKLEPNGNDLELTINSVNNSKLFRPENVGFGYSYILSVLTALVISKEGSTLIVENPEAHLHPSAQAALTNILIDYANNNNIQLFIETHSDHVLNTLLRAVKDKKNPLARQDVQVLFFASEKTQEGHAEARVQALEITDSGHIQRPPKKFFEQYAIDLRYLYSNS